MEERIQHSFPTMASHAQWKAKHRVLPAVAAKSCSDEQKKKKVGKKWWMYEWVEEGQWRIQKERERERFPCTRQANLVKKYSTIIFHGRWAYQHHHTLHSIGFGPSLLPFQLLCHPSTALVLRRVVESLRAQRRRRDHGGVEGDGGFEEWWWWWGCES